MLPSIILAKEMKAHGNMPHILAAEEWMASQPNKADSKDFPLFEYFLDGVYVRAITLPKGSVITGVIHKQEKITIIAQGKLFILDAENSFEAGAGVILKDPPGIKRFFRAVEDSTLVNVFGTDETDTNTIMSKLSCNTFEEYAEYLTKKES